MNKARAATIIPWLALAAWISPVPAGPIASAQSGCGPAPTVLENPPEMARVDGRIQSIDLEVRQDGDRLCFVDHGSFDRPAIAPTIRMRPGELLRVRLVNRITDTSPLRTLSSAGHPTDFPGVANRPGYFAVRGGAYHEPTGNTNLHFHGLEIRPMPCGPGTLPGDDVVTTYFAPLSIQPVPAGACQSAYEIVIPDDQPPGLYWYHTHFHGESEAQTLLGLSGAIVVETEDDDARRRDGLTDRILIVRDHPVPEPEHAAAAKPATADSGDGVHKPEAPPMPRSAGATAPGAAVSLPQCAFGKCINTVAELQCSAPAEREQETTLSVNGISIRDERNLAGSLPEVTVGVDREELWRLVNASADTYLRVHLVALDASGADRTIPVEVVGIDGAPFADEFGRPRSQTSAEPIVLPTGGRIEFKVKLGGDVTLQRVVLRTEAVESGCAGDLMPARDLVAVRIDPAADSPASTMPSMQSPVAAAQQTSSRFSDVTPLDFAARRRTFAFTEYQRPLSSKTDFYITEVSRPDVVIEPYPMHGMPSSVVEVQAGAVEEWTILNFTHEIHSFHIHQIHFRVLESDVKFLEHRMLDTINVPPAMPDANWSADDPVTPGRVRLLMRFHRNIAGMFVFHCHILSHEDKGMMGLIRVLDTSSGQSDRLEQMRGMEHLH